MALVILSATAACQAEEIVMPEVLPKEQPQQASQEKCVSNVFERVAIGTRLRITIYGHEDISREVEVGPEGMVIIPMMGEVKAEGQTTKAIAKEIISRLEEANLISPAVEVEIVKYPQIYITGLVGASGVYDYKPRINIRQAVALAGGFNPRARTSSIRILRHKPCENTTEEIMGNQDSEVLPADTIEVLRRWF